MYKIVTLFLIISYCYNGTAQSWEQVQVGSLKNSPDVFFLPAHTYLSDSSVARQYLPVPFLPIRQDNLCDRLFTRQIKF